MTLTLTSHSEGHCYTCRNDHVLLLLCLLLCLVVKLLPLQTKVVYIVRRGSTFSANSHHIIHVVTP